MRTLSLWQIVKDHDIFDFDYEYVDKLDFERRFIDQYIDDQMGFESLNMFKHRLKVKVQRLAPHYNRQYELLDDLIVELERGSRTIETSSNTSEQETTSENTSEGTSENYRQDYGNVVVDAATFDNINEAARSLANNTNASSGSGSITAAGSRHTENINIPLHEAIANIKRVYTDITADFIDELADLFSYVVW